MRPEPMSPAPQRQSPPLAHTAFPHPWRKPLPTLIAPIEMMCDRRHCTLHPGDDARQCCEVWPGKPQCELAVECDSTSSGQMAPGPIADKLNIYRLLIWILFAHPLCEKQRAHQRMISLPNLPCVPECFLYCDSTIF